MKHSIGEFKMATTTTEEEVPLIFVKAPAGAEDLMFGFGSTAQLREGENTAISLINASHIPYDSTRSVKDVLDELLAAAGA